MAALAVTLSMSGALAQSALADRVFWTNQDLFHQVSFAGLDGSGGADLNTAGATTGGGAVGLAIDTNADRIYWANPGNEKISFAGLDGSGGGDLNTNGATVDVPNGVAIDPNTDRIYWANANANKISWAKLDGSGGGDLNTSGATVSGPSSVAVDPAGGKIYWANWNSISWAKLDGSGGDDLSTAGATVNLPEGVAVDLAAGKIYWANFGADKISFASLDGSGGGDLNTPGVTVSSPEGVAIDPAAGRIYWASSGAIGFANLDGSGGADLSTSGATRSAPNGLVLFEAPAGTGPPTITGTATPGAVLSCSPGSWAEDAPESFLYHPMSDLAYQWSLNGTDIAGAGSAAYTAFEPGTYRCTVTASNDEGSSSQASAAYTVASPQAAVPRAIAPIVSDLRESHRRWREGKRLARLTRRRAAPVGTTFSFRLNERARVTLEFAQQLRRRRVVRGRLTFSAHRGHDKVAFRGRLSPGKALKPGRYKLTIAATNAAGERSGRKTLSFAIER